MISTLPAPSERRETGGPFATALAGSLAVHAILFALLMLAVGVGGGDTGTLFTGEPLRARLTGPAPLPEPTRPLPPAETSARAAPPAAVAAPVTVPLPVPPLARPKSLAPPVDEERNAVLPDDGSPIDPTIESIVQSLHPGAARAVVEFDVPPAPRYPAAARAERRQLFLRVPAVVKEDGSIEVVERTFDDPLFGAAVREALAGAKVRPAEGAGGERWTVLTFYFESYASGESQRTRYEAR